MLRDPIGAVIGVTKDVQVQPLVSKFLTGAALGLALAWPSLAGAQSAPVVARPVVQSLPSAEQTRLNAALARLARSPNDVATLIEAGDAARGAQDYAAAIGFYRRANDLSAGNMRAKAGLASAMTLSGDALNALPLFEDAERLGATPVLMASDRGLAFDLVGDNAMAQRYYTQALPLLSGAKADELRIRMAIGQAIMGDGDTAYRTLLPLLNKQDKPGWRTRAFTLAIAGDVTGAVDLAARILPAPLSQNIAPYLRYMPRLTKAQQAAAANLGRFPKAAEIGRDDPKIAALAANRPPMAGKSLIPQGEPLGSGSRAGRTSSTSRTAATSRTSSTRTTATRTATNSTATSSRTRMAPSVAAIASKPQDNPDRVVPPDVKPAIVRDDGELPPLNAPKPQVTASATLPRLSAGAATPVVSSAPALAATPAVTAPPVAATKPVVSTPVVQGGLTPKPVTTNTTVQNPVVQTLPAEVRTAAVTPPTATALTALPAANSVAATAPTPTATSTNVALANTEIPKPAFQAITPVEPNAASVAPLTPPASAGALLGALPAPPPETGVGAKSLFEIFADLGAPTHDAVPVSGAVDIRKITPAAPVPPAPPVVPATATTRGEVAKDAETKAVKKPEAKAEAKPKVPAKPKKPEPPAHPARIWVQIGVGRDTAAIAFDWRRFTRENAALFRNQKAHIAKMGRTNRMLVGPFATRNEAMGFVTDARKQGFNGTFPWESALGEVVDPL